ncbi:uncharacterized protein F5Z01DRAFT_5101 [Emericellopsis atlantica]|uniref:Uncharacterized protein n=1 Tax=Emericellopsis atlantica TaxID=2614577 RepID=A0A9P7ZV07_9HYPO|nr:uncharacterized protein F5Z01DRAFT_5101 [Emericellopsis atlantica]KAG9258833.1 hypothetical protein F5Z01DRAFT_5101 [Emericellopsis atlantica]
MNSHQCKQCGSCFARQEHLNRHAQSHTNVRPHACPECDKSFARLDVLRRHVASHAAARMQQASNGDGSPCVPRACRQCAASRVRCTREQPSCRRCDSRSQACVYPPRTRRKSSAATSRARASPNEAASQASVTASPGRTTSLDNVGYGGQQGTFDEVNYGWETWKNMEAPPQAGIFDPLAGLSMINWLSPETAVNVDWTTWTIQPTDMDMGTVAAPAIADGTFGSNGHGMDICDEPFRNAMLQVPPSPPPPPQQQALLPPSSPPQPPQSSQARDSVASVPLQPASASSTPTEPALYVEGAAGRLPFKGRGAQHPPAQDAAECLVSPDEHASAENTVDTEPAAAVLSEAAYANLVHHVQSDFAHLALALPPIECAQALLRLYFRTFHVSWSFLPTSLPYYERPLRWPTLLALVTVGARYVAGAEGVICKDDLAMLLDAVTLSLLEADHVINSETALDAALSTVQASILSIICLINNGSAAAFRRGKTKLYAVVELCRSMSDRSEWDASQEARRASLMVWMLDTHISFMFSSEPLLRLVDADGEIPSPRDSKALDSAPMTVPTALEILYMEKGLPPNLDDFSTNVIICAIHRRTKETVVHHQSRLSSWTPTARVQHPPQRGTPSDKSSRTRDDHVRPGSASRPREETWPPSLPILSKWRNAACDCLDILHWSANSIVARNGGWEHPVVLSLHLSRLMLLTPSRQLQHMASSPPDVGRTREAWGVVAQWALGDQYKARLSVVHAGALLWHMRRCRTGGFLEPFALYMATLVLWAYSSSLQLPITREAWDNGGSNLTTPPGRDSRDSVDPDPTFLHLDRPLDDELVQTFVKRGSQMAGHLTGVGDIRSKGAASKILRIGVRMLPDGHGLQQRLDLGRDHARARESAAGAGPSPRATQADRIWGIESVYAERLQRLIQPSDN